MDWSELKAQTTTRGSSTDERADYAVAGTKRKSGAQKRARRHALSRIPFPRLIKTVAMIIVVTITFVAGMIVDVWAVLQLVFARVEHVLERVSLPALAVIVGLISIGLFIYAERANGTRDARAKRLSTGRANNSQKVAARRRTKGAGRTAASDAP
jgi:hypothetical protein